MALLTSIARDDEYIKLNWNGWHLQCMVITVLREYERPLADQILSIEKAIEEIDLLNERPSLEATALDKLANTLHSISADLWGQAWAWVRENEVFRGGYTLREDHTYELDIPEGSVPSWMNIKSEVLELKKGDVLWMNL